jgi:hypothetical protein
MILNGALLLASKSLCIALLAIAGREYVVGYLLGDMGLYFVYKLLRRDLWHWIPLADTSLSAIWTVVERVVVKILVDFTGVVQLRAPGELGGIYFAGSQMAALAVPYVTTRIMGGVDMGGVDLGTVVGSISAASVLSVSVFLLSIKRGYVSTFFSTRTGRDFVTSKFLREGDESKSAVFKYNVRCWLEIREDVQAWCSGGWDEWEVEKPEWFSKKWKARVHAAGILGGTGGGGGGGAALRLWRSCGRVWHLRAAIRGSSSL